MFVNRIIVSVENCSFSLNLKGVATSYFHGEKGLRQGDPMSPSLFFLAMEVLSRMLRKAGAEKVFNSHPKCRKANINHVCFADDLLIFVRGDLGSAKAVVEVFKEFADFSGLQPNCQKSCFNFGGVTDNVKQQIL